MPAHWPKHLPTPGPAIAGPLVPARELKPYLGGFGAEVQNAGKRNLDLALGLGPLPPLALHLDGPLPLSAAALLAGPRAAKADPPCRRRPAHIPPVRSLQAAGS